MFDYGEDFGGDGGWIFKEDGEATGEEIGEGIRIEVGTEGVAEGGLDSSGEAKGVDFLMLEDGKGIATCFGKVGNGGETRGSLGKGEAEGRGVPARGRKRGEN